MAERRMFAKTIIDSDAFLDMPLSSQSLYFHLSMRADDDGFINNPKKIQRMIGASEDDLKLLIAKRFIIPFESGIVVIKHWKIHNYIRGDRKKETVYPEEMSLLETKSNGAYTIKKDLKTICQSDDSHLTDNCQSLDGQWTDNGRTSDGIGKDRIGKDRKGKNNNVHQQVNDTDYKQEFDDLWSLYPKKRGNKTTAYNAYVKAREEGISKADVLIGINTYRAYIKHKQIEERYVLNGQTFFCGKRWNDDYNIKQTALNDKNVFNRFDHHEYDFEQLEEEVSHESID